MRPLPLRRSLRFLASILLVISVPLAIAQTPGSSVPSISQYTTTNEDLPISPGDLIAVTVFDTPEFSGSFRVGNQGNLALPLIGAIHIAGLTTNEAARLIRDKLIQGNFLKDPQVNISFVDFTNQNAVVLGEVAKPGAIPILGARTLWEVVGAAGGPSNTAGPKIVIVHRTDPAHPQIVDVSWDKDLANQPNPQVLPGDTIQISRAGIVYAVGQVGRQGAFPVIHEHMTMLQLISLAEGTKSTAKGAHALLSRKTSTGRQIIEVDLPKLLAGKIPDFPLQNEDILYVPISTLKVIIYRGLEAAVSITTSLAIYRGY